MRNILSIILVLIAFCTCLGPPVACATLPSYSYTYTAIITSGHATNIGAAGLIPIDRLVNAIENINYSSFMFASEGTSRTSAVSPVINCPIDVVPGSFKMNYFNDAITVNANGPRYYFSAEDMYDMAVYTGSDVTRSPVCSNLMPEVICKTVTYTVATTSNTHHFNAGYWKDSDIREIRPFDEGVKRITS